MTDSTVEGLAKCRATLQLLAPKLAPNCSASSEASVLSTLEEIYSNEGVPSALRTLKESAAKCLYCHGKSERLDVEWQVDVAKRRIWPKSCSAICRQCADIRDLPSLMKKLCFEKDTALASRALRHFLEVNGQDAAKSHLFQDAVSVAHAIFTVQKGLRLTPTRGPPLKELVGVEPLVETRERKIKTKKKGKK
mmetsp:Transcript_36059/g.67155  ORF Transcript_36059/g.67155 Transcript_36059/m.67155 type:complete len:193 (-) Transcript_36059:46-624(-)